MNKENRKFIWKNIQKTGDYLFDKLPDHPNHPNGRTPYAHVALKVKTRFGKSYKEHLDDIFDKKKLNNDISYYLHRPTATDETMAPKGNDLNKIIKYLEFIKKEDG